MSEERNVFLSTAGADQEYSSPLVAFEPQNTAIIPAGGGGLGFPLYYSYSAFWRIATLNVNCIRLPPSWTADNLSQFPAGQGTTTSTKAERYVIID
jgi:hypothetical protein